MENVVQKSDETRQEYLVRVAITMLEANGHSIDMVKYDEAECDAFCLADDLKIEFGIETEE